MNPHKIIQRWIEYYLPDWRRRCWVLQSACKQRLRTIQFYVVKLCVQYLAAVLCFILVFGMVNYFWFTFRHTPAGNMFLDSDQPEAILAIFTATKSNLVPLAFRLTLDTAVTCLLLGLVCRLLAVTRYFYEGRGLVNRLLWYIFCAAITSLDLLQTGHRFDLTSSFVLYLIPASCLTGDCLKLTSLLLPEMWIVFRVGEEIRQIVKTARIRNDQSVSDHGSQTSQGIPNATN